ATLVAAHAAGADAVKLQTYTPDTITIDCDNEYFRMQDGLWAGKTLYQLYQEAYTPWDWYPSLKVKAAELGIELFSSPFDHTAVDFLQAQTVPAYKIASFEIFDIPLIKKAADCGVPIILSTGMATLAEIAEAVDACYSVGNSDIILLKCTSAYPAPIEQANLAMMTQLREQFKLPVGLSDHTMGSSVAVAAAALGAVMIEKHFILDKALGGPDAAFSMTPDEFAAMVRAVREVESAIGCADYALPAEVAAMRALGRSLFVVADMEAGEVFTETNLRSIRPGAGLHPRYLPEILGKKASRKIARGTPLSKDDIA
ncbi:MAG: pseudaminic acid synthase, partial [Deferribacteraceae bacterium]|nr:pseudaminic acid synthase [Deferribacteraceae bacterium]